VSRDRLDRRNERRHPRLTTRRFRVNAIASPDVAGPLRSPQASARQLSLPRLQVDRSSHRLGVTPPGVKRLRPNRRPGHPRPALRARRASRSKSAHTRISPFLVQQICARVAPHQSSRHPRFLGPLSWRQLAEGPTSSAEASTSSGAYRNRSGAQIGPELLLDPVRKAVPSLWMVLDW
jgi:hypothetical protein